MSREEQNKEVVRRWNEDIVKGQPPRPGMVFRGVYRLDPYSKRDQDNTDNH